MTLRLSALAADDPVAFDALVTRLRALGVVKLGALVLGPKPNDLASRSPREVDPHAAARRHHGVLFASTSIRPPMPEPVAPTNGAPRAVVQRRARDEAPHGARDKA